MEARFGAKMQQKSDSKIRGAQVIVELATRSFVQFAAGLRLDDKFVIHDQIEPLYS